MAEDGVTITEDEAERASFAKDKHWGLLATLAWIATGDLSNTYRASRTGERIDKADISMAVSNAVDGNGRAYRTVADAWRQELAPAIADNKISGSGSIVTIGAFHERREVGHTFPTSSKPSEALHLELAQRGHEVALTPKGNLTGQADAGLTEWRDLIFPADEVRRRWPPRLADYCYLSDALAAFLRFRSQHGPITVEDVERDMLRALQAGELGLFIEDGRGSVRRLSISEICQASEPRLTLPVVLGDYYTLIHDGDFRDWTYWIRMSPAAQAQAKADIETRERLRAISEAEWTPPLSFALSDLKAACGGHRPWLSMVVNFMAFGAPTPPQCENPEDASAVVAHRALLGARYTPAERLVFESGRRGENRFVGVLKGERDDRQIPPTVFDHPQIYWPDNIIRQSIEHLEGEEYAAALQNPVPDWTRVRVEWEFLKPWLIERGARLPPGESNGQGEAINLRLSRGEISLADAERQRQEAGVRPGVEQPNRSDFDPAGEIEWSISMAVLWIAHGRLDMVVEGMDTFAEKCWYARSKTDGIYYGPDDIDQLDGDAIAAGYAIKWLAHDDLHRLLHHRPKSARYREAFETLRRHVMERNTKTYGVRADTRDVIEIEPYKWSRLRAWSADGGGYFLAAHEKSGERFFDVWIRRDDVPGISSVRQAKVDEITAAAPAGRRGRPPKFPWIEGFDDHLLTLFEHHGDFDPRDPEWYQEGAVNIMFEWCQARRSQWPELPSATGMREHIQTVRETYLRKLR